MANQKLLESLSHKRGGTPAEAAPNGLSRARAQTLNVLSLETFGAGHDLKTDHLALIQGLKPFPDNRRVMHKDIRAGFLNDEAKPVPVIEPFYFAAGHSFPLPNV
jgi:hypothetical protein